MGIEDRRTLKGILDAMLASYRAKLGCKDAWHK
jgi:hypothetical protein